MIRDAIKTVPLLLESWLSDLPTSMVSEAVALNHPNTTGESVQKNPAYILSDSMRDWNLSVRYMSWNLQLI